MIDAIEDRIYDVSSRFPFIEKIETLLKTPNTIKIKLSITYTCFIQVYQNIQKGIISYVLVSGNQRLFGRDCDGKIWHRHPVENPDSHDFSEDGSRTVSFEEFLYEVSEKLVYLEIL